MKGKFLLIISFFTLMIGFSERITNYTGNEIYPVLRKNLYFIMYDKNNVSIIRRSKEGELKIIKDEYILPAGFDVSQNEEKMLWVSNKVDSRGVLKLHNFKTKKDITIETGKGIEGVCFITNDQIAYSADKKIYVYNIRDKKKIMLGNGLCPFYYNFHLIFSFGNNIYSYSFKEKVTKTIYENNKPIYYPIKNNAYLYFIEKNPNTTYLIYDQRKVKLFSSDLPTVTLNSYKDKIIASRKFNNYDIIISETTGDIPIFKNLSEIDQFLFKNDLDKMRAYDRHITINGIEPNIVKRLFFMSIKNKLKKRAHNYLGMLKEDIDYDEYIYYNFLYRYIFGNIGLSEFKKIEINKKYKEKIDILYANYLFNLKMYDKALLAFKEIKEKTKNKNILFSSNYNLASIYCHFGDLWENISLWQVFFSRLSTKQLKRYYEILIKAFDSDMITLWEKIYFAELFKGGKEIDFVKATIFYKNHFYDHAEDILKNYIDEDSTFLKLKIAVSKKDLTNISKYYGNLKDKKIPAQKEILTLLNVNSIFSEKNDRLLKFLYNLFPDDFRVTFWYFFYLSKNDPSYMKIIMKHLSKNDRIVDFKRFLYGFLSGNRLYSLFYLYKTVKKWENPIVFAIAGVYEYKNSNYEKAKNYLLKAYMLSNDDFYYINSIILSYLGKVFYRLEDYENLNYYLSIKYDKYDYFLNSNEKVDTAIVYARTLHILGKSDESIKLLEELAAEIEILSQKIKLYSYIAFLAYITKDYNKSLVYTLKLINEKEKIQKSNFTLEYKLIGNIYLKLKDYRSAESIYMRSLEELKTFKQISKKSLFVFSAFVNLGGGKNDLSQGKLKKNIKKEIYNNLITTYSYLSEYKEAQNYLEKRMELLSKKERKNIKMAISYNHFGINSMNDRDLAKAIYYFKQSFSMLNSLKIGNGLIENLVNLYDAEFLSKNSNTDIPFSKFITIIDRNNYDNDHLALLFFLRTLIEIDKIPFFNIEKFEATILNYERRFKNIIILERYIDDLLENGSISDKKAKALVYLAKYAIAKTTGSCDGQNLKIGIKILKKIPLNSLLWYFYYLNGEIDNAYEALLSTMEKIPSSLLDTAGMLLEDISRKQLKNGDLKNYILTKEYERELPFFNSVVDQEWLFPKELQNIYYKNVVYLKNKLLSSNGFSNRDYDSLENEIENNKNSAVNFFIHPFSYPIDTLLNEFKDSKILFIDEKNKNYILFQDSKFEIVNELVNTDYQVIYSGNMPVNTPFGVSLNMLYLSKINFNYNPAVTITITETTKNISGYGVIYADKLGIDQNHNFGIGNIKLKTLMQSHQVPYHLFFNDFPSLNEINMTYPILILSGFSTLSTNVENFNIDNFERKNKFDALKNSGKDLCFAGYRGIEEEKIEDFTNNRIQELLGLAIDNYKKKKWGLSTVYFQNLINIYGNPLENNQKLKIYSYFINSLYHSKKYDIGIFYLDRIIRFIEKDEQHEKLRYKFLNKLISFYNAKKDFGKALKTAQRLQDIFKDDLSYIMPILLNQVVLLEANGYYEKAFQISSRIFELDKNKKSKYSAQITLTYAHFLYLFQKDLIRSKELFERGLNMDIEDTGGENISKFLFEYLKNLIDIGEFGIEKKIEQYKKYIDDEDGFTSVIGMAALKRGDLLKVKEIIDKLLLGKVRDKCAGYNLSGLLNFLLRNFAKAQKDFEKAKEYAVKSKNENDIINIRSNIALLNIAAGNFQKALDVVSDILKKDRKKGKITDILYDLRLLVVIKDGLHQKNTNICNEMLDLSLKHGYKNYENFAIYMLVKNKSSKKRNIALKNFLKKNITDLLRVEILYKLAQKDKKYYEELFEIILKQDNITNIDIVKNGFTFDLDKILANYLENIDPQKALLKYYYFQLKKRYDYDHIVELFNEHCVNGYQIVILKNKIFTFNIKDNKIERRVEKFDRSEFEHNWRDLITNIEAFSDLSSYKNYFSSLLFKHIEESNFNLFIAPTLLFFPFSIFENKAITLYAYPFYQKKAKINNDSSFISDDTSYNNDLKKYLKKGYFVLLDQGEFNNINPYLSKYGDLTLKETMNAKLLIVKINRSTSLNNNILPYFSTYDHIVFLYGCKGDESYYAVFLRKLFENNLNEKNAVEYMRKKYTFPRYYSLFNFITNR